jgi:hypothetical protein
VANWDGAQLEKYQWDELKTMVWFEGSQRGSFYRLVVQGVSQGTGIIGIMAAVR